MHVYILSYGLTTKEILCLSLKFVSLHTDVVFELWDCTTIFMLFTSHSFCSIASTF